MQVITSWYERDAFEVLQKPQLGLKKIEIFSIAASFHMGKGAGKGQGAATEKAVPPRAFFDGTGPAMLACGWPIKNVYEMVTANPDGPTIAPDEKGNYSGEKLRPYHDRFSDYVGVQFSCLPKIFLTIAVYIYTVDFDGAAKGWDWSLNGWELKVIGRDLFLMVAICGVWDWILYFSPLKERLTPFKFNKRYPSMQQISRDAFWTTSATILGSAQEILLMKWWASGAFKKAYFSSVPEGETSIPYDTPFFGSEYTPYFILWTMSMLYWRIFHFHCIHRGMHPWFKSTKISEKSSLNFLLKGDIGAFLYRHVHAHHHKSYNPTAFSGFSM
jgi:hypothetical protein